MARIGKRSSNQDSLPRITFGNRELLIDSLHRENGITGVVLLLAASGEERHEKLPSRWTRKLIVD